MHLLEIMRSSLLLLLIIVFRLCQGSDDDVRDFLEMLTENDDQFDEASPEDGDEKPFRPSSFSQEIKCRLRGKIDCSEDCVHGKQYSDEGCCQCKCRKNYAAIASLTCRRASWSSWGRWSECIETEWGGLQTKERICRSNGKKAPGACVGRGSQARTCSKKTKAFRIRKNLRDLSDEELHDLIQAMTKFKKDSSERGYRNIISWHGFPGRCPWYHNIHGHSDNHCSWHHHPLFLPWHRMITVQLELGLQRYLKNKTFGIPYWDWTEHDLDVPYLIRHPQIYDPILKKYVYNPFYRTFIRKEGKHSKLYSHRNIYFPRILDDNFLRKGTVMALLSHDYFTFDQNLADNPHDQIHNCFCYKNPLGMPNSDDDWCTFGMPTVDFASWDPVFILHHSAMDRIFSMRRHLEETVGAADWTQSRVVGEYLRRDSSHGRDIKNAFSWPLAPFCNDSMNPESITRREDVWTLHKSYYNEQLFGYEYDNFNLGGNYTWDDLKHDFKEHIEKTNFWDDTIIDTKMGKLSVEKICPIQELSKGMCILKC